MRHGGKPSKYGPKKRRGKYEEQRLKREAKRAQRALEGYPPTDSRSQKRRKGSRGQAIPSHNGDSINVAGDAGDDFIGFGTQPQPSNEETQFFGLLEPSEQEYYSNVNSKIVANDFESEEDRQIFVEAVYRESKGKEIKLASSQSCSRYLEKLIMLSTSEQLLHLITEFLDSLTYLVQHRFGSHCCETLFLEAARYIGSESQNRSLDIENALGEVASKLESNIGYLLTDRFASHTVRVLFLVLAGEPLDDVRTKSLVASKKKEKLDISTTSETTFLSRPRNVPKSLKAQLNSLVGVAVSGLDTTSLRALATHPTGSPVFQLLLHLELKKFEDESRILTVSVLDKFMPDVTIEPESDEAKFITSLMYDPTGSHLVEVLVRDLPGKRFKRLYKGVFKGRLGTLARNEVASHVANRVLERVGQSDLVDARDQIVSEIPTLVRRRQTGLIRILIERCATREVDLQPVADALFSAYGSNKTLLLQKILAPRAPEEVPNGDSKSETQKTVAELGKLDVHGSLLAQSMLQAPIINSLILDSLLEIDLETRIQICKDLTASRVVQVALTSTMTPTSFRKLFIPSFYGQLVDLASHPIGSYVVDALWTATSNLHFMKERLAEELAEHENELRTTSFGRTVWRNWSMDKFKSRRKEWQALAKGLEEQPSADGTFQKTAIQLAREKHAKKKSREGREIKVDVPDDQAENEAERHRKKDARKAARKEARREAKKMKKEDKADVQAQVSED